MIIESACPNLRSACAETPAKRWSHVCERPATVDFTAVVLARQTSFSAPLCILAGSNKGIAITKTGFRATFQRFVSPKLRLLTAAFDLLQFESRKDNYGSGNKFHPISTETHHWIDRFHCNLWKSGAGSCG